MGVCKLMTSAREVVIALSAASALAMLYVGAYQVRAVEHLRCPLFAPGCEAVADAPFARPLGVPDGFIAAGLFGLLVVLAAVSPRGGWARHSLRTLAALAALANILGVIDMARFGAYCFWLSARIRRDPHFRRPS